MSINRKANLALSSVRARRRRLFWIRFYIVLFIFLVILFTLAILSGHEKIRIKNFQVRGNDLVPTSQILDIANRETMGRYFGLFARKNFLLFPRFEIKETLLEEIKNLTEVKIGFGEWQTVTIEVEERRPHAVWCGELNSGDSCYFTDETGYIFDQAPKFSGNLFVRNYGALDVTGVLVEETEKANPIGKRFLSSMLYQSLFTLVEYLAEKGLEVSAIYFDGLDYTFTLKSGPKIIFNAEHGGFAVSFDNLFVAIETNNLDLLNSPEKINYVDLRFDGRVVVGKK